MGLLILGCGLYIIVSLEEERVIFDMWNCRNSISFTCMIKSHLPTTRSEEREVLGVWSIPVAIIPSCQGIIMQGN